MDISKMLDAETINLHSDSINKYDAIKEMANMLYKSKRINDLTKFIEDVFKREKLESTNMDMGVAVPHSNSIFVDKTSIAIVRFKKEIDWEDGGEPVRCIFLFAVSKNEKGITHLDIIAKIAEILIDDDFIDFLNKTDNSKELINKINDLIGGLK